MNIRTVFSISSACLLIPALAWSDDPNVYDPSPVNPAVSTSGTSAVDASRTNAAADQAPTPSLTPDQLDSLVAPIALYPDPLLSQIFVASTYPLEIIQAYQWLQSHVSLAGTQLTEAAAQQNWDPSVQALVPFPDVMKRLSDDISWTTNLGNAFLANQGGVMDSVQRMRVKAEEAGKLSTSTQQKVTTSNVEGQQVVEIQPANPDVIYVPQYNPEWIWGEAPAYYPYPGWYYPPVAPVGFFFLWGSPIWCNHYYAGWNSWGGWGWRAGWHSHNVIVNNTFIERNHFNVTHVTTLSNGRTVWEHNGYHRQGVPYTNRGTAQHYQGFQRGAGAPGFHQQGGIERSALNVGRVQQQLHESSMRVREGRPAEHLGGHEISSTGYAQNRSAFGGMQNGSMAHAHAVRGYSSLGAHASPGGHAGGSVSVGGGHSGGTPIGGGGASSGGGGGGHMGGGGGGGGHH